MERKRWREREKSKKRERQRENESKRERERERIIHGLPIRCFLELRKYDGFSEAFLIYVNEVGKLHGIYVPRGLVPSMTSCEKEI